MTDTPPTHDPPQPPCLKCGYDNTGLAPDSPCPECGAPEPWSRGAPLTATTPSFRRTIRIGLMAMVVAGALAALEQLWSLLITIELVAVFTNNNGIGIIGRVDMHLAIMLGSINFVVYTLLGGVSLWLLSADEKGAPFTIRVRPVMRWCAIAAPAFAMIDLVAVLAPMRIADTLSVWVAYANEPAAAITIALGYWFWTFRVGLMMNRTAEPKMRGLGRTLRMCALVAVIVYLVSFAITMTLSTDPYFPELLLRSASLFLLMGFMTVRNVHAYQAIPRP